MKKVLNIITIVIILVGFSLNAQAIKTYAPNSSSSVSADVSVCLGSTASAISFTYNTCNSGGGSSTGIAITVEWYKNTTNSTTGGTLVSTSSSNSATAATGTVSYTPSTSAVGVAYYYCVISWAGSGTCRTSGTLTSGSAIAVTVKPATLLANSGPTSVCGTNSVTLSNATVGGGTWSTSDASLASVNSSTGVVRGINPGNCNIRFGNGCGTSASTSFTVYSYPTVNISGSTVACAGRNTTLTASGATNYSWSPVTGMSATTGASVVVTPTTTTTYTVTGANAGGCSNTASRTITVNALPVITVSGSTSLCSGTATSLSAAGGTTYSWSPAASLNQATGVTVTASPTLTTTYTVTGADANGCTNTATLAVTVNARPVISIGGTSTICAGSATTLTASGGVTYSWASLPSLSATTGSVVIASPVVTTIYTVTGIGANNCSNTATRTVTVNALPAISATSGTANLCYGSSTTLSATGGVSYSWAPSAGLSATTGSPVTVTPSVATTYTVSGTNANGCSNTASVTVNVTRVSVSPASVAICRGSSVTLTASGAATYSWSPSSGLNTATGNTVVSSTNTSRTYTVTGVQGTCTLTATAAITVNALPTINTSVSPSASLCAGSSATMTASGGVSYSWLPVAGLNVASGSSVIATPTVTTTYTVTGVTAAGCAGTNARTITVSAVTIPTFVTMPATAICTGTATTYATESGQSNYVWTIPGSLGTDYTIVGSAPTTLTSSVVVKWLSSGVRTVTATYTAASGCTSATPASAATTVVSLPAAPALTGSSFVLVNKPTTLTASVAGGSWSFVNPTPGTITAGGIVTINDTGMVMLNYAVSNSCGSRNANIVVHSVRNRWMGGAAGAENDWTDSTNWLGNVMPDSTYDAVIPSGVSFYPHIPASGLLKVHDINIEPGGDITMNDGATLVLKGRLHNHGHIHGNGKVLMNGNAHQNMSGSGMVTNLEIDNANGVTIDDSSWMAIGNKLTITRGTLDTHDSLYLNSDETGTASIAALGAGAHINGKVHMRQYVQAGYRRYRFWSHPFSNSISLGQLQSYIDITGTGGAANGFTTTTTNASSAFRFDTYTSNSAASYDPGWKAITNITAAAADSNRLHKGQAIRLFVRGSKGQGLNGLAYSPNADTVEMLGNVNEGTQVIRLAKGSSANQDYNLLGNPYPSPVDIGTILYNAKVAGAITGAAFYVWNPSLGFAGQYQTVPIGAGAPAPYYLPANAAFQVRAAHDGDSLVFHETDKAAGISAFLFRPSSQYTVLGVYDGQNQLYDMLQVAFNDNATENEDADMDAIKMSLSGDMDIYSTSADGKQLAIDTRPYNEDKVVPVSIRSQHAQQFVLKADQVHVPAGKTLYLHDKLTGVYTELQAGSQYTFDITKDKATQGNRFELTAKPALAVQAVSTVSVVPNPATDKVTISLAGAEGTVTITDVTGAVVYNNTTTNGKVTVALANFATGVYCVSVNSNGKVVTQKLVKN